jgi:hypothetical protein
MLKKPQFFLKTLGPSILFVALSLNGGEMLLWPNLVSNYSLTLLWFIPIILTFQWATDVEISRTTAFSGKFVLRELAKNFHLKYFFLLVLSLTLAWPAWISVAGSTLGYLVGIPKVYTPLASIAGLLALLPAFFNKAYYSLLERLAKIGLVLVLFSIVSICIYLVFAGRFSLRFDNQWWVTVKDFPLLYAAVAYGGVAGLLNFTQADWIKSKQYANSVQSLLISTKTDKNTFLQWMKFIAIEHGVLFWLGNLLGIMLIAIVSTNILPKTTITGFGLIEAQLDALNSIQPILKWLWGVGVISLFTMAQLTIMDAAGRLWVDISGAQENNKPKISRRFIFVGVMILLLSFIIPAFKQPEFLLQLSAGIASFSFSFLPIMVVLYNKKHLPSFVQAKPWQTVLVIGCSLFYTTMTLLFFYSLFVF